MKFLISTDVSSFRKVDNDSSHMWLCDGAEQLSDALSSQCPLDVWICDGAEVTQQLMDQFLQRPDRVLSKSVLVRDLQALSTLESFAKDRAVTVEAWPVLARNATICGAEAVLRAAEMLHAQGQAKQQVDIKQGTVGSKVILVGAGIVNLITAEYLTIRGLEVHIVDRGPNPQSCDDWTRQGCTHGGGNARMFTYMEADNYNEKSSEIYSNMRSIFRKTALDGGWSLKAAKHLEPAERDWVGCFENLPAWLARSFRNDIYQVNRDAGDLWNDFIKTAPDLFDGVMFRKDILRMYVEDNALEAAMALNDQHGTIVDGTTPEEFLSRYPQFSHAAAADHLAGGFTVQGFTVNIHPFVSKLIDRITALGGKFTWNCDVSAIHRDASGAVTSLDSQMGLLDADHFVISPGTTGNPLLSGTASEDMMQGVVGVWLQLPNLDAQLQNSIKIHRRGHLVEDINVSVAKDPNTGENIVMLGGGYGYVGLTHPPSDCPELASLFNELENVARIYFPEAHAIAKQRGTLWPREQYKYCIRPFTATGLGVFERIRTSHGGQLIITGGNNTGGFAQAPAIARAVWRAIAGEHDPMHVVFHPRRGRLSVPISAPAATPLYAPIQAVSEKRAPRLLLLCSDGPQHLYLRHRVHQAFPGYRCIVETHDGQIRHLMKKGRTSDVRAMQYHTLRRSLLGYEKQRKEYFHRLVPDAHAVPPADLVVDSLNCKEVWEAVEQWKPDFTIISGTKFIGKKLNERCGLGVNLHMGHLPEYKGNHCIFFALYDGAVEHVAATIHQLTGNLDGGAVLEVVRPPIWSFDNEETLYTRCLQMAMDRSIELAGRHFNGEKLEFIPQEADGRLFKHSDRTLTRELWLYWSLFVRGLLKRDEKKV